jgi:hypothetical protein
MPVINPVIAAVASSNFVLLFMCVSCVGGWLLLRPAHRWTTREQALELGFSAPDAIPRARSTLRPPPAYMIAPKNQSGVKTIGDPAKSCYTKSGK